MQRRVHWSETIAEQPTTFVSETKSSVLLVLGERSKRIRLTWAGQRPGCAGGMWLIACSVMAVIVSDGLTPGFAGMVAPSQTNRLR